MQKTQSRNDTKLRGSQINTHRIAQVKEETKKCENKVQVKC